VGVLVGEEDGTSDGQFDGVSEGLRLGDLVVGESVGVHVALPPTTSASCLMSAAARL